MKKSLLAILGAALLMVGCTAELETAVTDLTSRLEKLEAQVEANKAAIEALQKAEFITDVAKNGDLGWNITLSNGDVLAIYNGAAGANGKDGADGAAGANGADGKDGDAFFKSVEVQGDVVVFTLVDGSVIKVPYLVEFAIEFLNADAVVKAGATTSLPYRIIGKTEATKVHVIAGGDYVATVNEEDETVEITAPETITPNKVVVFADRGDGKVSVKTLVFEGSKLEITNTVTRAAYFWGDTFNVPVVSNVPVTFSADVPWLTFKEVKAVKEYTIQVSVAVTPTSNMRSGHIYVKDENGDTVQTIDVTQGGTSKFFLNNQVSCATWADAVAAIKAGKAGAVTAEGVINVVVSEGDLDQVIDFTDSAIINNSAVKSLIISHRPYGVPAVDANKTIIRGVRVKGQPLTINGVSIVPKAEDAVAGYNSSTYPVGVLVEEGENNVQIINTRITPGEGFVAASGTLVFSAPNVTGTISLSGCSIDGQTARCGQFYGAPQVICDKCTLENGDPDKFFRLYGTTKLTLTNNMINTNNVVDLYVEGLTAGLIPELKVDENYKLTSEDSNIYGPKTVRVYTRYTGFKNAEGVDQKKSVYPGKKAEGPVMMGGVGFATIEDAIAHAGSTAVIELKAGSYDANVKVANGKNITIKAAAGALRDSVIINGNVEIAGSATIKGVTIATKEGVTNNTVSVSVAGDGYVWGHQYLVRVENGASNVTFENVRFDATAAVEAFKNTLSMLWISQATNIVVKDCQFDTNKEGAYCTNQTHLADVVWTGNIFNGGGANEWAIRAMDTDVMTIADNRFYVKNAVQVYKDFTGTLTFGDGKADNNIYGGAVAHAIDAPYDRATYVFEKGAKFLPANVKFNAATTGGEIVHKLSLVWSHIDDAEWAGTLAPAAIGNVRNSAFTADGMYLGDTNGHIVTLDPATGAVKTVKEGAITKAGLFALDGMTTLADGTVLISNLVNGGTVFEIYSYDGTTATKLVSWTVEKKDGVAPRLGDMITASGTKDAATVYTLDYSVGSGRVYFWDVKPGTVLDAPTKVLYHSGFTCVGGKPSIGTVTPYLNDTYYLAYDGTNADQVLSSPVGKAGSVVGTVSADYSVNHTRGAKFFTVDGVDYLAVLVMSGSNGTNSYGGKIHVIALPNKNLVEDLKGATSVCTYDLPSGTANPNACGNLSVVQKDGRTLIGVNLRSTGAAVVEFI